ncbi:MAG: aliphatic sulfonate ABC transporter substrate-binding protein [Aquabacterium sp.]|jgi:NitT/TauT family transport system substrate-binding protein|nr:MAG: aliphatic sulfonate ABC transporter substrate-binding protein [Aquabacterium sp.]TAL21919.1 MAG: aliphatic sulfonate ABC transporter substrate-binding protein [Aquabacterium sp.]
MAVNVRITAALPSPSRILQALAAAFVGAALFVVGMSSARAEIKVGVSDWPGWVAWYVAEQKGYFKKHGAEVKLVWFANYTDSISALSAGQLDANSQTWSDTMGPLAKGIALKTILVNDNSAGNDALVVGPKIKAFPDLKGRSIALEQFSVSHFVLVNALAKNGMKPGDVKIVNLSAGDAAAAFMSGRVDAAVVWNPWIHQIEASGKGRTLFTSKDLPGLIPDLLVAQEKSIAAKRRDYVGMIRAWFDTVAFIQSQPDEAAKIMSKVVSLQPAEYKLLLPGTRFFDARLNQEAMGPAGNPLSLLGVAPTVIKFLSDNKLIEGRPDPAKGIDASLLAEALKAK